MRFDLNTLEFPKILTKIATYAETPYGKQSVLAMKPSTDISECRTWLEETEEMRKLIVRHGRLPFGSLYDVEHIITALRLEGVLTASECFSLEELLYCIEQLKSYFQQAKNEKFGFIYLQDFFNMLQELKPVRKEINRCIDEKGLVKDQASPTLAEIRHKITNQELSLRNKMNELLKQYSSKVNEHLIVFRNDRMCLPVKAEFKHGIKGIIHDESASGTTVYIEPYVAADISNKITQLKQAEIEEIKQVLLKLSTFLWKYYEEFQLNFYTASRLDHISAKARFSMVYDCTLPELNEAGIIHLKQARHPLIDPQKVVPVDIRLGEKHYAIIITGPNTGGKTVALKTTGLLTIMAQSGILVPVMEHSRLAVFDNIFADIGDEQSIEQSLSSFSSHMVNVEQILRHLTINSLVLLDELGSGTDPKEGANLAISIIEYLLRRGTRLICTTHYADLKAFAYDKEEIMNASVEFDVMSLKPTYRLLLGVPGRSNAIIIAKNLGLPENIIKRAEELNVLEETDLTKLLRKLEAEHQHLTEEIKEYQILRQEWNEKLRVLEEKEEKIRQKERDFTQKATQEANQLLEEARKKSEALLAQIELLQQTSIQEHEIAELKYQVRNLHVTEQESEEVTSFQVGDQVLMKSFGRVGVVKRVLKDRYEVSLGNLTAKYPANELELFHGQKTKELKKKKVEPQLKISKAKMELDLRGFRFEEVSPALDQFVDDAYLAGLKQISVIHGFGTGAVRKAVYAYLKSSPYVESARFGGENEGLNGATIVTLK